MHSLSNQKIYVSDHKNQCQKQTNKQVVYFIAFLLQEYYFRGIILK